MLEIGTGSGVIALLLAFVKGQISPAVEIQKEYTDSEGLSASQLEENIQWVKGIPFSSSFGSRYDVVVSILFLSYKGGEDGVMLPSM